MRAVARQPCRMPSRRTPGGWPKTSGACLPVPHDSPYRNVPARLSRVFLPHLEENAGDSTSPQPPRRSPPVRSWSLSERPRSEGQGPPKPCRRRPTRHGLVYKRRSRGLTHEWLALKLPRAASPLDAVAIDWPPCVSSRPQSINFPALFAGTGRSFRPFRTDRRAISRLSLPALGLTTFIVVKRGAIGHVTP